VRARAPRHPRIGAQVDPASVDAGSLQVLDGPIFCPLSHFMNDFHWCGILLTAYDRPMVR